VIEFRILGPFEAVRDGRVLDIGGGKRRTLLAVLLIHANEVVSSDRLIDDLWGERAPSTAPKIVQGYVSQLRKVFTSAGAGHAGGLLVTQPPGYALRLEEGQLDVDRFARLATQGRGALAGDAAGEAATVLRQALALWRGPALAEFAFEPFARDEIARLDELRLSTLEDRVDADLCLGRHEEVVAELQALVARHPLRERLVGQLMIALYRGGRQAEALQAYQTARGVLGAELGLEPGRGLQDLEQAILRQDPELEVRGPAAVPAEPRAAPASTEQPVENRRPGGAFVGRGHELAVLVHALDDALAGRGRLVFVGGEPGIGKSRLAEELAARAGERGARIVWGRCWAGGGAPPYWPWVQALRACAGEPPLDESAPPGSEIGDLVARLGRAASDVPAATSPPDPGHARFQLFDSTALVLKSVSRARPLVLVLDDLNWADTDSLQLLEFVSRELDEAPVLLVGTYRDVELSRRHPLSQTLGELARASGFERVMLSGLSPGDVARFIEAGWSIVPDPALVHAVHAQTEGNPFFVREVVQLLADEGALTPGASPSGERWSTRIPEGVREAIGRRLERLSEPCNESLRIAAVIGREFSLVQLTRLIDDLTEDELLEALEEALAAHVIEELHGTPGGYQFTHALIQGTLADELSQTRRVRLHARIAEALEELYGSRADVHAAELAHHFAAAQSVLGAGKVVRYSMLAGEAALAGYAPKQALEHFERALGARGDRVMDDEAAELHFGVGRAQLATLTQGELTSAVSSLRKAFDHYLETGDAARAVAVASFPLPLSLGFHYTDAPSWISSALTLVPADSHEAGALLTQHGGFIGFLAGGYAEAERAFEGALAIAEREHDEGLEQRTLAAAAFVDAFHLRWESCLTTGARAIAVLSSAADPGIEIQARRSVAWALVATGKLEEGKLQTAAALGLAQRLRGTWWVTSASFSHALLCMYEGDWNAAREVSELGLTADPRDPRHLGLRAVLESEPGDPDESAAYLDRLQEFVANVAPPGSSAAYVFVSNSIMLASGAAEDDVRLEAARAAAAGVLALPRLSPALALYSRSALALIAAQSGDVEAARVLYGEIESQRGTASFFLPLTFDRLLGRLAATFGDFDLATSHFESGLAFCERADYRPEYGRTARDYADALRRRAGPGDDAKAVELEETALATARDLGMPRLTAELLGRPATADSQ
jgi:DNA-binding SARP family transcriptional activator